MKRIPVIFLEDDSDLMTAVELEMAVRTASSPIGTAEGAQRANELVDSLITETRIISNCIDGILSAIEQYTNYLTMEMQSLRDFNGVDERLSENE